MLDALLLLAALLIGDPVGDTVGMGALQPPTAAAFRNLAPFDLRSVSASDEGKLALTVEMGSLADPFGLPLGFSLPVVEIYLDAAEGGMAELLPGSGMRLPQGRGWEYAVRLTGDGAWAYRAGEAGVERSEARVTVEGGLLLVETSLPAPERARLHALVGLYDLFGPATWRPLADELSPWAFSDSTGAQAYPVVDVLAADEAAQRTALETGVLPGNAGRGPAEGWWWYLLMAAGLLLALAGVALRAVARRPDAGRALEPVSGSAEGLGEGDDEERPDAAGATSSGTAPEEVAPEHGVERGRWGARKVVWDSSALLDEPDAFDEEFASGVDDDTLAEHRPGEVWARPVPLGQVEPPGGAGDYAEAVEEDGELEVLMDEAAGEEDAAAASVASPSRPEGPGGEDAGGEPVYDLEDEAGRGGEGEPVFDPEAASGDGEADEASPEEREDAYRR